jgi:TolA-binding protein
MRLCSPSPGTPGEGRGEGDFERRTPLVLEITLTPTLSRSTGRGGGKSAIRLSDALWGVVAVLICLMLVAPVALCDPPVSADAPAAAPQAVDPAAKQLLAADGLLQRNLFKLAADAYEQFLHDYPQNAQITAGRYGLAICRYRLGQFDAAEPLLRQVLADAQFGQADQVLALLGYCELSTKNYGDAIGHFDQLIEKFPQSPQADPARLYRAQALYLAGEPKEAAAACQAYLQTHTKGPDAGTALYFLALSDRALDQSDPALAALDRLTHDFPDSPYQFDAALLSGQTLAAQGKNDAALERYRQLLAIAPEARKADAHYTLGVALFRARKLDEAAKELSAAANDSADTTCATPAKLQLGLVDLASGHVADARAIFNAIATPDSAQADEAKYGLAQCDLADKNFDPAKGILEDLLRKQPAPPNRPQIALYHAICLMELAKFADASKEFDALADGSPAGALAAEALYRSGYCLAKLDDFGASHDRCQRVAKLPPTAFSAAAARLDAGNLFHLRQYSDARSAYSALLSQTTDSHEQLSFRLSIAQCDYFAGKFAAVVDELTPLASDPSVAQSSDLQYAVFLLGDAQLQLGKNVEAAAALKKYVGFEGNDTREAQYKLSIAELRGGEADAAATQLESLTTGPADSQWVQRGLLALGQLRYKTAHADAATEALNKLLASNPAPDLTESATYLLGWIDFDAKRFAQAAERWKDVSEHDPDHTLASDAAFQRGVALQQANQNDDAVAAFNAFADAYPKSPDAPRARQSAAAILSAQGKNDDALRILMDLGQDSSASDSVLYDLAWAQRKTSHVPAAEETYRRIVSQYPDGATATLARTELAELLYDDKSYSQAAAMLWPVVNAGKADAKVLAAAGYRLGWCYQKLGDFDKAADCFRNFVSSFPHDEMAPSALLQCALADADAGRDEEAQKELAAMLQQYPEHKDAPVAMLKLADVQAAQNDFAGSLKTAQSFLAKYPSHALSYRAHFCIGWALENQKKYDPARAAYQQVIAASNGETAARAQFQIGETFLAEQRFEEAIPAFLAVEDVYAYPKWSARALLEAGRTFEQLKQMDQARAQYNQLTIKYKDAPEAELAAGRLKSISGS